MKTISRVRVVLCDLFNHVDQWMSAAVGLEQCHIIGLDRKCRSIMATGADRTIPNVPFDLSKE